MEKIELKLITVRKMVIALKRAITRLNQEKNLEDIEYFQDSVASRFRILIESTWKIIKLYLENEKFEEVPSSPKGVLQFARQVNFLSQVELDQLLRNLDLRNLASHLYDQPQYILVIHAAPEALELVQAIIKRIESRFQNTSIFST